MLRFVIEEEILCLLMVQIDTFEEWREMCKKQYVVTVIDKFGSDNYIIQKPWRENNQD